MLHREQVVDAMIDVDNSDTSANSNDRVRKHLKHSGQKGTIIRNGWRNTPWHHLEDRRNSAVMAEGYIKYRGVDQREAIRMIHDSKHRCFINSNGNVVINKIGTQAASLIASWTTTSVFSSRWECPEHMITSVLETHSVAGTKSMAGVYIQSLVCTSGWYNDYDTTALVIFSYYLFDNY